MKIADRLALIKAGYSISDISEMEAKEAQEQEAEQEAQEQEAKEQEAKEQEAQEHDYNEILSKIDTLTELIKQNAIDNAGQDTPEVKSGAEILAQLLD